MRDEVAKYLDVLEHEVARRLDAADRDLGVRFAELFWTSVPDEDLEGRNVDDDVGATISCWRAFERREHVGRHLDIDNPDYGREGWQSRHTVIELIAPDSPFMVDSVLMEISHQSLVTHFMNNVVFAVERDEAGRLTALSKDIAAPRREVMIYAEIDRVLPERFDELMARLTGTIDDVAAAVGDFPAMKAKVRELIEELGGDDAETREARAFLEWISSDNFTFLGYREFDYDDGCIRQRPESSLGVLRNRPPASERRLSEQPEETRAFLLEPSVLSFSKSGTRSRVHRPAYPDYIGVKRFDETGDIAGERGFLGLYTSPVYTERPSRIPYIRRKVAHVIERSGLDPRGFDGKVLSQVLATYPRDELFQIDEEALLSNAVAITYIHERRRTRMFLRREPYGLFYTCLVYLPRDLFNTDLRLRIQRLLIAELNASDSEFEPSFSESILVRLQFILRVEPNGGGVVDADDLERRVIELTVDWSSELNTALIAAYGEQKGRDYTLAYARAFPAGYREQFSARAAAYDVGHAEALSPDNALAMRFYRWPEEPPELVHLKVFHLGEALPLSGILPTLENMGLFVKGGHPFRVQRADGPLVSVHDFDLSYPEPLELTEIGGRFEDAFVRVWRGDVDDDPYNTLVIAAGLDWRQVALLRAYGRYMKQIRFGFSQEFISATLVRHPRVAARVIDYFQARFDPAGAGDASAVRTRLDEALEQVELLNEDRILRRFIELVDATKRTNFFQRRAGGEPKPYIALKFMPHEISTMPPPVPAFEIFVSSVDMEGTHLRGGPIARGGLRWSDRLEDYRTEVLGLVKAQVVKNAVIVPTGAKGGFVVRSPAVERATLLEQGVACYRQFICALLDVTDNIEPARVTPPPDVRRHDVDDPYLVVAADKGTATFSDVANGIADEYGFWLGDAFASGGSNGYDHKEMGITAKGTWISVARHFRERGIDVQHDPISVLGIGDMSGDVFGNGMLRSRSIRLLAAFNHMHVFLDPDPDPEVSFEERERLYALPRSTWVDYDSALISRGGGVFSRTAKSIPLSPEARKVFGFDADRAAPDVLINMLLRARVDLIFNGGIGTYVKASTESHADVGDRANDALRVDADELRCQVIGEGGNLGVTQAARVEFSLAGGAINTDFIDNAAGVDCSDHEVNIKILLNHVVADGDLTVKQRNELLHGMTDDVAKLVLTNNFRQAQTLSLAERHARARPSEYRRFVLRMESLQDFDRTLEGIPADDVLFERVTEGRTLGRPELAVLLAYAKIHIKDRLIASDVHLDPALAREVLVPFPAGFAERFAEALPRHRLFREIVATQAANDVVHHMGITFVVHLSEFVGGDAPDIVRAYYAAAEVFGIRDLFRRIEAASADEEIKLGMMLEIVRLGRRASRWLLRHRRRSLMVEALVAEFGEHVRAIAPERAWLMGDIGAARSAQNVERLTGAGVDEALARDAVGSASLAAALPIVDAATTAGAAPLDVAQAFAEVGRELDLDWLLDALGQLVVGSHWQAMERDALQGDVITHQARIAARVVAGCQGLAGWLAANEDFAVGWRAVADDARHAVQQDFSLYSMTCRKLTDLSRTLLAL